MGVKKQQVYKIGNLKKWQTTGLPTAQYHLKLWSAGLSGF